MAESINGVITEGHMLLHTRGALDVDFTFFEIVPRSVVMMLLLDDQQNTSASAPKKVCRTFLPVVRGVASENGKNRTLVRRETTRGRYSACDIAPGRVAFRYANSVGTSDFKAFAAHWLACSHPCQRFATYLAVRHA